MSQGTPKSPKTPVFCSVCRGRTVRYTVGKRSNKNSRHSGQIHFCKFDKPDIK